MGVLPLFLIVTTLSVVQVSGRFPIPRRELGFVYGNAKPDARIHFNLFIDLLCSESKVALATLKNVADYYGPDTLRLTTHLCPLPYFRNGFKTAMGTHVVNAATGNGSAAYDWMTTVYDNMHMLTNYVTFHLSEHDVMMRLTRLAGEVGVSGFQFLQGMSVSDTTQNAKVEWKYCCTRGVAEVPTFMINDVTIHAARPTWTEADWRAVIDPLLGA